MKNTKKEGTKTNNKSMRIDNKVANVSMQVSSEQVKVSESKSVSCQKEALKSVQFCNNAKVTVTEKHQEEPDKRTHKWKKERH